MRLFYVTMELQRLLVEVSFEMNETFVNFDWTEDILEVASSLVFYLLAHKVVDLGNRLHPHSGFAVISMRTTVCWKYRTLDCSTWQGSGGSHFNTG